MRIDLRDISTFIRDHASKVLIALGVMSLTIGLVNMSHIGSLISAGGLLLGTVLIVIGFFAELGILSADIRSLNGVSTLLLVASAVCFVGSVVSLFFVDIKLIGWKQEAFRGALLPYWRVVIIETRPFAWLSKLLAETSIGLFVVGVIIKIYHELL